MGIKETYKIKRRSYTPSPLKKFNLILEFCLITSNGPLQCTHPWRLFDPNLRTLYHHETRNLYRYQICKIIKIALELCIAEVMQLLIDVCSSKVLTSHVHVANIPNFALMLNIDLILNIWYWKICNFPNSTGFPELNYNNKIWNTIL